MQTYKYSIKMKLIELKEQKTKSSKKLSDYKKTKRKS